MTRRHVYLARACAEALAQAGCDLVLNGREDGALAVDAGARQRVDALERGRGAGRALRARRRAA